MGKRVVIVEPDPREVAAVRKGLRLIYKWWAPTYFTMLLTETPEGQAIARAVFDWLPRL